MTSTLDVRLSGKARAFLRSVRHAGGSLDVERARQVPLAEECTVSGLLVCVGGSIGPGSSVARVAMTGRGYAYLDRLMRAH